MRLWLRYTMCNWIHEEHIAAPTRAPRQHAAVPVQVTGRWRPLTLDP